jgi:hypothetical protein
LKRLRKIFLYSGAVITVVVLGAMASAYLFRDKIINRFVEEANKHLATPVKIGKMDVSMLADFPEISIEFSDVYVEDSHPETFPLFTAKKVSFSLNAYDAWNEKYSIKGLKIRNSETNIRINAKGKPNYVITKDSVGSGGASISFDIQDIQLRNQHVIYADEFNNQNHEFSSEALTASIIATDDKYNISAVGDVTSTQVGIGDLLFFHNKEFAVKVEMVYDDNVKLITFKPSSIKQGKEKFELKGTYAFADKPKLDLKIDGQETSLQTIFSLLPESLIKSVEQYESEGDLYFGLTLKGGLARPSIIIEFGSKNATILHPETKFRISKANLTGKFTSLGLTDFSTASLQLKNVSGQLNNRSFAGNFELRNFNHPIVDFKFKGELEAASLKPFFDQAYLNDATGVLIADVSLVGELEKLKNRKTAQQVKIEGAVEMKDVSLSTRIQKIDLKNLTGNLQFTNNDLAMSDVRGKLGRSDFLLNGFFKNIVSYLLFENQPIGIETDLRSQFLDLDELLQLAFGEEASSGYEFSLSPNLYLNFDCKVGRLKYLKFKASDLSGDLLVKSKVARTNNIKLKTMGGSLSLEGILDARKDKRISLTASSKLNSIHLDSIFYVFGNFRQNWLRADHLKGQTTASVQLSTDFTPNLKIIPKSLVADMDVSVKKGELNNFEPLQQLKKYLDDDGLKNLRFADLKNEIHVENDTILIPQMEVRSNVTTIQITGIHTFDQKIDYRIVAPLLNKKKINIEEAGEAVEKDLGGRLKVYFKITGTTDNYKVAYDTDALKRKISGDLKKEVAELKDAFKDKNKKKTVELEKDDYFDWDNQ